MYWFLLRPRWLAFHALVIAAIVVMVNLGFWQLRRLEERQDFNAQVEARADLDPVPIDELVGPGTEPSGLEWRLVTATGTFRPEQIPVFNRSLNGRAGDNLLAILEQDDGTALLVNRGFVPPDEQPPPPDSEVTVVGRIRDSQDRRRGGLTDRTEDPFEGVQRIEVQQIAGQVGGMFLPVYVDLVASDPAVGDGDPLPIPDPELSEGPHLSYAAQWFIFSVCVLVGWVLAVRLSLRNRRGPPDDGAHGPDDHGDGTDADGDSTDAADRAGEPVTAGDAAHERLPEDPPRAADAGAAGPPPGTASSSSA